MQAGVLHWGSLGVGLVLNATANILLKVAARNGDGVATARSLARLYTDGWLVAGIVSFALALAFYSFALTRIQLSVAYPTMTSLGLVLVFVASALWFGEAMTAPKLAGAALIVLGVVLLAR